MKRFFILLVAIVTGFAFWSFLPKQKPHEVLSYVQHGKETVIAENQSEILIDREDFGLRFFSKRYNSVNKEYYSVQIAAFRNKDSWELIQEGQKLNETACFGRGMGMAAGQAGYEALFIRKNGHHYLFYEDGESGRVELLEERGEYLKLEFQISQFSYNGKTVAVGQSKYPEIYLAILTNRNLNDKIDKGELRKLKVRFKNG
ncbi:hypothetical protein KFE98_16940 [bacterium SCSIO 12741]|nr:hypothetical protein KFE98_16940 [bacterium SCSIO 12741]